MSSAVAVPDADRSDLSADTTGASGNCRLPGRTASGPDSDRKDLVMENDTNDLMSGITVFATAEEIAAAEQVETLSPTTTVLTTWLGCDEA
jgi:hypothetical protein